MSDSNIKDMDSRSSLKEDKIKDGIPVHQELKMLAYRRHSKFLGKAFHKNPEDLGSRLGNLTSR